MIILIPLQIVVSKYIKQAKIIQIHSNVCFCHIQKQHNLLQSSQIEQLDFPPQLQMPNLKMESNVKVEEPLVSENGPNICQMIQNQIREGIYSGDLAKQQQIIEYISQNLLVKALVGQPTVLQPLQAWLPHQFAHFPPYSNEIGLLQLLCQTKVKSILTELISYEYYSTVESLKQEHVAESSSAFNQCDCQPSQIVPNVPAQNEQKSVISLRNEQQSCEKQSLEANQLLSQHHSNQSQVAFEEEFPKFDEEAQKDINLIAERTPGETVFSKQLSNESNFQQESANHRSQYIMDIEDSILQAGHHNQIQKVLQIDEEQSSFSATKLNATTFGHPLYGDHIQKLLDVIQYQDELYILIEWKQRSNGHTPSSSILPASQIKQHFPHQLITHYENMFPKLAR